MIHDQAEDDSVGSVFFHSRISFMRVPLALVESLDQADCPDGGEMVGGIVTGLASSFPSEPAAS
jgi:hypothetical protein